MEMEKNPYPGKKDFYTPDGRKITQPGFGDLPKGSADEDGQKLVDPHAVDPEADTQESQVVEETEDNKTHTKDTSGNEKPQYAWTSAAHSAAKYD